MTLEEFSENIQKMCHDEIGSIREIILNREEFSMEEICRTADALRKYAMLWIDVEKRKKPKESEIKTGGPYLHAWSFLETKYRHGTGPILSPTGSNPHFISIYDHAKEEKTNYEIPFT